MRVAGRMVGRQVDTLQQRRDAVASLGGRADAMDGQRLGDGGADRHARVERRIGVLEDHLRLAAQRLHRGRRPARHGVAIDHHLTRERDEAEHGLAGGRFAGAALADEAERLPGLELEADVHDGRHRRLAPAEPARGVRHRTRQVSHEQHRAGRHDRRRRVGNAGRPVGAGEGAEARHRVEQLLGVGLRAGARRCREPGRARPCGPRAAGRPGRPFRRRRPCRG